MPGSTSTFYTARFLMPDLIERGRANSLSCPVYLNGTLVAPTSGTISIYDSSNTALVDAASVTVTGSIATYSYSPASTVTLSDTWRVEWTLVLSGATKVFRNQAALVRNLLYPVITDIDLFRRHRTLDPSASDSDTIRTSWQDVIDEAWAEIQLRLIEAGNRPNLILSPYVLREVHLFKTLELVFQDLAVRHNETYQSLSDSYAKKFLDAWSRVQLVYDTEDTGESIDPSNTRSLNPTVWLCARR